MLHNVGSQTTYTSSIAPQSCAAGATNGGWVDITQAEGEVVVPIQIGAVTGSVIVKVQDATDTSGTGAADLSGVTTASLSAANTATKLVFPAGSSRQAVRVVATVTTGPVLVGASVGVVPKIA